MGDGFIRVDADGRVTYASPNALSVYRKLGLTGDLSGKSLAEVTRELVPPGMRPDEETISAVLGGRMPRDTELGNGQATVILRAIPLRPTGERTGGLVLLRDVTDLRRRDRELVTKDATIREIHHRVKNNLQTVAALLRLQARRIDVPEGRVALEEAVRRVGRDRGRPRDAQPGLRRDRRLRRGDRPADPAGDRRGQRRARRSAPGVRARSARSAPTRPRRSRWCSPSCVQNAVEHAFDPEVGGTLSSTAPARATGCGWASRTTDVGLPAGFRLEDAASLGLSIVSTLVGELGGTISLAARADGPGTRVVVQVPNVAVCRAERRVRWEVGVRRCGRGRGRCGA